MRDFPVFTTEYGVASLILKEIPYQGNAFVIIRDTKEPEMLLAECVSFCRICGAERVYATGHEILECYPLYTAIWLMRCRAESLPETDASLFPVQEKTLPEWRRIYNEKVQRVPNGAWMTEKDGTEMLQKGEGYFVHRNGELLGIGKVSGNVIDWVAAVRPGAGQDVVCTLAHAACGDALELTVASGSCAAVVRSIFMMPLSVNALYGASFVGSSALAVIQP
jgi:hypothetical protein